MVIPSIFLRCAFLQLRIHSCARRLRYSPDGGIPVVSATVKISGHSSESLKGLTTEVCMIDQAVPKALSRNWRELYTAALFETDKERVPARIADAEKAILVRARELFAAGSDTIEEDQALDDALYALRALQSCLNFRAAA